MSMMVKTHLVKDSISISLPLLKQVVINSSPITTSKAAVILTVISWTKVRKIVDHCTTNKFWKLRKKARWFGVVSSNPKWFKTSVENMSRLVKLRNWRRPPRIISKVVWPNLAKVAVRTITLLKRSKRRRKRKTTTAVTCRKRIKQLHLRV